MIFVRQLSIKPKKQQAWHKQIKQELQKNIRTIDRLSIAQIRDMYENKKFLCDTCGAKLDRIDLPIIQHITHMINPRVLWSCDDCIADDFKNNRVIGVSEVRPQSWQLENR